MVRISVDLGGSRHIYYGNLELKKRVLIFLNFVEKAADSQFLYDQVFPDYDVIYYEGLKKKKVDINIYLKELKKFIAFVEKASGETPLLCTNSDAFIIGRELAFMSNIQALIALNPVVDSKLQRQHRYLSLRTTSNLKGASLRKLSELEPREDIFTSAAAKREMKTHKKLAKLAPPVTIPWWKKGLLTLRGDYPLRALFKKEKLPRDVLNYIYNYSAFERSCQYDIPVFFLVAEESRFYDSATAAAYFNQIKSPRKELFMLRGNDLLRSSDELGYAMEETVNLVNQSHQQAPEDC